MDKHGQSLQYNLRVPKCPAMSLQQKQQYLRTEIVEKGHDAEKFYQFWQSFSIDLGDATMEDVISVVTEFQRTRDGDDEFGEWVEAPTGGISADVNWDFLAEKKGTTTEVKLQPEKKKHQPLLQTQTATHKQSVPETEPTSNPEPHCDLVNITFQDVLKDSQSIRRKCLKLQSNILQHHTNLQIQLTKYREITQQNTGIINKLWKGSYWLFTIKTLGRNKQKAIGISWEVQRQYNDFVWLRNMLVRMYPGLVVPPLPVAGRSGDQFGGYVRKLESFLMDCFQAPELRNSKYYEVFLSYASLKDFETFKKSCEGIARPKNLGHVINMQGEIKLLYSDKIDGYAEGLQSFLTKTSQHLKNVKTIIKQIDQLYTNVSTKYKQLSQVFMTMSQQSFEFSEEQCYPRLTETYKQISQLVNQHSYFCALEKQFLQTYMQSHFAYERDRVDNMQNLITKRKTFAGQYAKPKHQGEKPIQNSTGVFGKIAGLFGEKTQSLQVPATDTVTLRDQVGFYNSQLMNQSVRSIQGMISSQVSHFSMYGHSRIDNVESMQKIWSKLLVELSKLNAR